MIETALLERFKRHVMFLDDSDNSCWIWTGALKDDGRGRFFKGHRGQISAQRMAWMFLHGEPPPPGHRLLQVCNHPQCVRHWKVAKRKKPYLPRSSK